MLQQIFGFINLEQMEYESADISNDNNVSFSDFSYLLNNIVFNSPLPGDIWQFNESFVDMSNRSNDSIKRDTLIEWGVLEGDVEGVWEPSGRFPKVLNHTFEQVVCNSNEIIEVTIGSDYDNIIKGLDLNIKYPLGYDIIDIVFLKSVSDTFLSRLDLLLSAGYTLTKANNNNQISGRLNAGYLSNNEQPFQ